MKRSHTQVLSLIAILSLTSLCNASGPGAEISKLRSDDAKERQQAAEAIVEERVSTIQELIKLASQKLEPSKPSFPPPDSWGNDSKHVAIRLLGEYRAAESISCLLANLEYRNPKSFVNYGYLGLFNEYPAAESLSKIGMPSVNPVIDKLRRSDKDLPRTLCSEVLRAILGKKYSTLGLEDALSETREAEAKANISAAIAYLEKSN